MTSFPCFLQPFHLNCYGTFFILSVFQADVSVDAMRQHFQETSLEYVCKLQEIQERKKFECVEPVSAWPFIQMVIQLDLFQHGLLSCLSMNSIWYGFTCHKKRKETHLMKYTLNAVKRLYSSILHVTNIHLFIYLFIHILHFISIAITLSNKLVCVISVPLAEPNRKTNIRSMFGMAYWHNTLTVSVQIYETKLNWKWKWKIKITLIIKWKLDTIGQIY